MVPTPITYLMAGGVGLVLGLVLDWLVSWPWWVVVLGFVVLVWLFFLASAFWGPRGNIGDDLLRVINPHRASARELQRMEEAVSSGSLVGFEMSDWEGESSIGGWGGSLLPRSLTIRHGDPAHDPAWMEVTARTGRDAEAAEDWLKDHLVREVVLSQARPPRGLELEELHHWHLEQERRLRQVELPPWTRTQIRIDGQPVSGKLARVGDHWVAFVRVGDVVVDITAKGVDTGKVSLDRLDTLRLYVKGRA